MPKEIGKSFAKESPEEKLAGGQPLWYWALNKEGKENELRRRAEIAGAKYTRDGSTIGLKEDGAAPEKASAPRKKVGFKMTRKRRAEIEERVKEKKT